MGVNPYTDPTTGQWVGEHETRDPDGEISRRTEWFDSEEEARRFARTGELSPLTSVRGDERSTGVATIWKIEGRELERLRTALLTARTLRIAVDEGQLKTKINEDGWSVGMQPNDGVRVPPDRCQHVGQHHSGDLVEVWHGTPTPALLCGFHAQAPIDFTKVRKEG